MLSKSELVKMVAEKAHLTNSESERCVDAFLDTIKENSNEKIQLRDFGSFSVTTVPARKGRNPQTGEEVDIPEKKRVLFKPSKTFKNYLNQ